MPNRIYTGLLVSIAALGGLLYGYDIGVIGKALPYMGLDESQKGIVASAIMLGAPLAGIVAGAMSDWLGRKRAMIISSMVFIVSVVMIVWARSFAVLFAGRMLQGLSAGMIAVVLPVYMSESTPTRIRGISSTMFQLCITIGISASMVIGYFYQTGVDDRVKALADNPAAIAAVHDQAWRSMFLSSGYPAVIFILVALLAAESPRWLFRHGKRERARAVLSKIRSQAEVDLEMSEMDEIKQASAARKQAGQDTIFKRRYMLPLLLAVFLLSINQATGINAVISFIETISSETGLAGELVKKAGIWVTVTNVVATVFGVLLVDVLGRKNLLKIGTGLIILALAVGMGTYYQIDAGRTDVKHILTAASHGGGISTAVADVAREAGLVAAAAQPGAEQAVQISVQYKRDGVEKEVMVRRSDGKLPGGTRLEIPGNGSAGGGIEIVRAKLSHAPSEQVGMRVFLCLIVYMIGFAFGPGVVLWLMSAELMPTRVRSVGMGIGVLGNAVVSAASTAFFLPVIGHWGYTVMFGVWLAFTLIYFLFAAFILPETKGKTLEEIEAHFARR